MQDVSANLPFAYRAQNGRFADYVRLHAMQRKLILLEKEHELLKAGVGNFGLSLSEARAILHGTAEEAEATLESQVERHVQSYLTQPPGARQRRLAERDVKAAKLSRRRFEQAVDFFQTLTREALSRDDARARVKAMVRRLGLKARRDWLRLGSRKWYNGIAEVSTSST